MTGGGGEGDPTIYVDPNFELSLAVVGGGEGDPTIYLDPNFELSLAVVGGGLFKFFVQSRFNQHY